MKTPRAAACVMAAVLVGLSAVAPAAPMPQRRGG